LAAGEPGVELDTNRFKIGNGTSAWNSLPYMADTSRTKVLEERLYTESSPINIAASILTPKGFVTTGTTTGYNVGGATSYTSRKRFLVVRSTTTVQLVFCNWWSQVGGEFANANAITVSASIENPFVPGTGVKGTAGVMGGDSTGAILVPVTFNGLSSVSIAGGGTVISDPVQVECLGNTALVIRTCATVASVGHLIPYTGTSASGNSQGDQPGVVMPDGGGIAEWVTNGNLTASGSVGFYPNYFSYSPSAILARPKTPVISVLGLYDSIVQGTGDRGRGRVMMERTMINAGYAYINGGVSGTSAQYFANPNRFRRQFLKFATHIADNGSINDIGSRTFAEFSSFKLEEWARWYNAGRRIIAFTIQPHTTSTNSFTNAAGQTPQASTNTKRIAYNNWLRDNSASGAIQQFIQLTGAPVGTLQTFDICEHLEVDESNVITVNGGRWYTPFITSGTLTNATATVLTDSSQTRPVGGDVGYIVYITGGTGLGQVGTISTNTSTAWTVSGITTTPASGSTYSIIYRTTTDGAHMSGLTQELLGDTMAPIVSSRVTL
jgi:lysophospholipase L1-like esterase